MENKDKPIHPVPYVHQYGPIQYDVFMGLTKREYFAAQAMNGFLSNSNESDVTRSFVLEFLELPKDTPFSIKDHFPQYVAKMAVSFADALGKELSK